MALGNEDRRKTRYVRLRKAIDQGIAQRDELKRKQPETEAVDPARSGSYASIGELLNWHQLARRVCSLAQQHCPGPPHAVHVSQIKSHPNR